MHRPEWFAAKAGGRDLLAVALDLHMGVTGSYKRTDEELDSDARLLIYALANWKPSQLLFDAAVKQLLEVAVQERADHIAKGKRNGS